jgi:hypothetical protein
MPGYPELSFVKVLFSRNEQTAIWTIDPVVASVVH